MDNLQHGDILVVDERHIIDHHGKECHQGTDNDRPESHLQFVGLRLEIGILVVSRKCIERQPGKRTKYQVEFDLRQRQVFIKRRYGKEACDIKSVYVETQPAGCSGQQVANDIPDALCVLIHF